MFSSILHLAIEWVVLTLAFLAAAAIVPGFEIKNAKAGFWVSALFAVLNVLVAPFLAFAFGVVTLGIACLLPGVVRFLVTVALLKLVDALSDQIEVKGVFPAALAAVVMTLVSALLEYAFAALA